MSRSPRSQNAGYRNIDMILICVRLFSFPSFGRYCPESLARLYDICIDTAVSVYYSGPSRCQLFLFFLACFASCSEISYRTDQEKLWGVRAGRWHEERQQATTNDQHKVFGFHSTIFSMDLWPRQHVHTLMLAQCLCQLSTHNLVLQLAGSFSLTDIYVLRLIFSAQV